MSEGYRIYGRLSGRESVALSTVLLAKGIATSWIDETPSLSLALESRSGHEQGPYLRTPEGFVLGGCHEILNWIERTHPEPALLPKAPLRRVCARMLEDWIECWLPNWPRRSWKTVEAIGDHLAASPFMLGESPTRPDWILAAWLETEVLIRPDVRTHLSVRAPRLVELGSELIDLGAVASQAGEGSLIADDVIPISLLEILSEVGSDYHAYLVANQAALKDGAEEVWLDLGLGKRAFAARRDCEARRVETGEGILHLAESDRRGIRAVLEPLGMWHALSLPAVHDPEDPADPRSL